MKKGLSHVDWAISVGLFLTTLIFLLIILRPGSKPEYVPDSLMDIAESYFFKNVTWEVKRIPLVVYHLTSNKPDPNAPQPAVRVTEPGDWSFDHFSPQDYKEYDIDSTFKPHLSGGEFKLECDSQCRTKPDHPFTLFAYPSKANYQSPDFNIACSPSDPSFCDAALGATETLEGIDQNALDYLKSKTSYQQVKSLAKFPVSKEFAIYISSGNAIDATDKVWKDTQLPYEQTNVYSKQIKYWILRRDGSQIPVTVVLQVW